MSSATPNLLAASEYRQRSSAASLISNFRGLVEDSRHLFVKSTRNVVHLRGSKIGHEGRGQVVSDAHTSLVNRLDE